MERIIIRKILDDYIYVWAMQIPDEPIYYTVYPSWKKAIEAANYVIQKRKDRA